MPCRVARPRALLGAEPARVCAEFFTRFTPPKSRTKWTSRLKCNGAPHSLTRCTALRSLTPRIPASSLAAYYYRVNYFCVVVLLFVGAFLRHPLAFFAVGCAAFTTLCLNDSFSHAVRHAMYARTSMRAALTPLPTTQRARRAHGAQAAPAARRQAAEPDSHVRLARCASPLPPA